MSLMESIKDILSGRRFLPECPECESGRLHKKMEISETLRRPGGAGKLYYGMRSHAEYKIITETLSCDRCDHKTKRKHETEERVFIH